MIYVHVPFCRSFCTYCDFYSEVASRCSKAEDALKQETLFGEFAQALATEAISRADEITDDVKTLYIGGGTPSVLPLSAFRRLMDALGQVGHSGPWKEFTVEVNPEDVVEKGPAYVEGLLELGVNRISMGVQSFNDSVLRFMNRRHSSEGAVRAYEILEEAGVDNISIDLIFGLPQLSAGQWRETLEKALSISSKGRLPSHISSYQLSVEPGSMLARMVDKGLWSEASDEICQEQYQVLCEMLSSAGYHHYEISNFALPGCEAVHNSAYWSHVPYVGLGPGAHSFSATSINGHACRTWNVSDLHAYLKAGLQGDFTMVCEGESLSEEQLTLEHIMLGLRTSEGLPADYLRTHCNYSALSDAISLGQLVSTQEGFIRIPEHYFFISDSIISSLV